VLAAVVGLAVAAVATLLGGLSIGGAERLAMLTLAAFVATVAVLRAHTVWLGVGRARVALAALTKSAPAAPGGELAPLVDELAAQLNAERKDAARRQNIFAAAADGAPTALVLLAESGRVIYANPAARDLLAEGDPLEDQNFLRLLANAPPAFRDAFLGESDALFTVEADGELETYHLSKRELEQDGHSTTLVLVKHLTREIRRQEVDVWKKLIRVLSHELNNSLAPITSLVHSARRIASSPEQLPKLDRVLATVEERAAHLADFLEGYARVARLPKPNRVRADWKDFLGRIAVLASWAEVGPPPERQGYFDPSQLEQVVLNLLKNADEAGGARDLVQLQVTPAPGGVHLTVSDRGAGMTEETLSRALLPFYSTKERGSGLGLPLCREIIEAHGGSLKLANRAGGGLTVTCFLPDKDFSAPPSQARLTLTRG
jgi:nitrogen fixation/metabolism regulation signal transduction histidine kinase